MTVRPGTRNPILWFAHGWTKFFFAPISPATIGMFRIFFGIVIFLSTLGRFPFRELFYTDLGIVSFKTMNHFFPPPDFLYFRWLPQADPALEIYFLIFLFFIVTLTLGLWTRLSSILVFAGMMSLSNRNFFIDNAGDDLMRINCFFLIFSHAGKAYSMDRWWNLRRQRRLHGAATSGRSTLAKCAPWALDKYVPWALDKYAPWAQRLIQLQLSFLYLNTVYLKLPGEAWLNGTALYYAFDYLELKRFDFKYLFYYLWQIKLATYGVMVAETAMFSLVWIRRFRYWVLGAAFALHEGINLTMQFPVFQYVMMTSLIVFIYPEDIERAVERLQSYFQTKKVSGVPKPSAHFD